jgi:hypothetical protein
MSDRNSKALKNTINSSKKLQDKIKCLNVEKMTSVN